MQPTLPTPLEPLKFQPALREKIWGTHNLAPLPSRSERRIGEAWCLHQGSRVADGPHAGIPLSELVARLGDRLMGPGWQRPPFRQGLLAVPGGQKPFPLAGKLIFCPGKLSVQVHPDDTHAARLEGCLGKTELWYVIAAAARARLGLGLREEYGPADLRKAAAAGEVSGLVRWVAAAPGQCVLIPAGTIHSAFGVVMCEVQQNSDVTYRLCDRGRRGLDGRPRTLQVDRALEVADVDSRPVPCTPRLLADGACRIERLGRCAHFVADLLSWRRPFLYPPNPSRWELLICIQGYGSLNAIPFEAGDAFLIPADAGRFPVDGFEAQVVRAYTP